MKNAHTHKKIVPIMVIFLMVLLTSSILLAQISLVGAQNEASLTGEISEALVDSNDDGIIDQLLIGVEVEVTTAGTYNVEVSGLYDASSNNIIVSNQNTTVLDAGTQEVHVYLDGTIIYDSGINPESISSIILYAESGATLDSLSNVDLTGRYYYSDFGVSPAYLTGVISDDGVDTDDDGEYNELLIGVEVNVTQAGTYTVEVVKLYDEYYDFVDVSNRNTTYLNVGIHVVYVSLSSTAIYSSGINPETVAIIVLYDESGTSIDSKYDTALSTTYSFADFQHVPAVVIFDVIQRDVMLSQSGSIYVVNVYSITNTGFSTSTVDIGFPEGAYDFEVRDEMGTLDAASDNETMMVTLRNSIDVNQTETLYINYHLPWKNHVTQQNGNDYTLSFTFYEKFNSTIGTLTVSIALPKGAEFKSSTLNPDSITSSDLHDTLSFSFSDVSPSDDLDFEINYKYNVFWGSFYPTIWMGLLAVAAAVVFFFWGMPKTISAPTIQVPSKDLKSFVDTYEEKSTIRSELEALEERLQKGKIPRRRYKVRRKMLEGRLSAISRTLSSLNATIRASGSKYSSMMRELEVAEAKLEGAERDLQRVESRYRSGEISKGAYGKLLEEYKSRIEDAENIIDGVLIRLRD